MARPKALQALAPASPARPNATPPPPKNVSADFFVYVRVQKICFCRFWAHAPPELYPSPLDLSKPDAVLATAGHSREESPSHCWTDIHPVCGAFSLLSACWPSNFFASLSRDFSLMFVGTLANLAPVSSKATSKHTCPTSFPSSFCGSMLLDCFLLAAAALLRVCKSVLCLPWSQAYAT